MNNSSSSKFWDNSFQKSLNKTFRKQELVKITYENQALLKRIQDKKPTLNFKTLEKERKENEKLIGNISQYGFKFGKNQQNFLAENSNSTRNNFLLTNGNTQVFFFFFI